MRLQTHFLIVALFGLLSSVWAQVNSDVQGDGHGLESNDPELRASTHTNNWAVLVSTSRFWFNYRHMANVLSMYRTIKRLGIPDSQIIMMLSDDVSCNPRNVFPGTVFNNNNRAIDLYGDNIEVDYRGYEVTVENFIRLLTDRWDPDTPRSKRLLTDSQSNIFIYMTGHGGNEFLKFQDAEEIGAVDIADAFEQMWEKKRYNEIFFMIDTCQANTMYSKFYSPNVLAVGSSAIEENSYSHHADLDVGVAVIDRFTYYNLEFLEKINKTSRLTMKDLFDSYDPADIHSHAGIRSDLFKDPLDKVLITDFFGNIQHVDVDGVETDLAELMTSSSSSHSPSPSPASPSSQSSLSEPTNQTEAQLHRDASHTVKPDFVHLVGQKKSATHKGSLAVVVLLALVAGLVFVK